MTAVNNADMTVQGLESWVFIFFCFRSLAAHRNVGGSGSGSGRECVRVCVCGAVEGVYQQLSFNSNMRLGEKEGVVVYGEGFECFAFLVKML